jgi:hypothetical protein
MDKPVFGSVAEAKAALAGDIKTAQIDPPRASKGETMRLWVVEIKMPGEEWTPTDDCYTTRADARKRLEWWRRSFPGDKYRACSYVRESRDERGEAEDSGASNGKS